MKEERIVDALGSVRDAYVLEAMPAGEVKRHRRTQWVAAVLLVLLGTALFAQTAPGAVAAAFAREQIGNLIEMLFPPKEVTIPLEGVPEQETFIAAGQEPGQDDPASSGFAVYYDPDRYEMTDENGATYIRAISVLPTREELCENNAALLETLTGDAREQKIDELLAQQEAFYAALPKCELEILHVPDTSPDVTAAVVRLEKQEQWAAVSEIEHYEPLACAMFHVSDGGAWDSPLEDLYFVDDGQTGTYQLTVRCFVEAAEGHGVRLTAILDTFEVLPPQ